MGSGMLDLDLLVGALSWDPQIRGLLILAAAVVLLPGTIYLLLATNLGARVGFLIAIAGLTGWMTLLGITWAIYGQGIKGRDPSWKIQEVVHSASQTDLSSASLKALSDFPNGWKKLSTEGNPVLADAQATADNFITKSGRKPAMGHEGPIIKEPTPEQLRYKAEFSTADEYVLIGGYEKGGDSEWFTFRGHKFDFSHSPHYVAVAIQPAIANPPAPDGTVTYTRNPDPTKPITSIVVLRDLGSIRFPQVMMVIGSGIIFGVTCHALHRRDKKIMALRAAGTAPATA
jgi:hypothetical protein